MSNNIVLHAWNDSSISQITVETKIGTQTIPSGYVNATQMCQANNKLWADYARLDTTKAYWAALSLDMGIHISNLVILVKGRGVELSSG